MKYSPNEMLEHIKEKELVFDFINSLACHVKNYTIAEITDGKFEKEEEGYYYKSKGYIKIKTSVDPLQDLHIKIKGNFIGYNNNGDCFIAFGP